MRCPYCHHLETQVIDSRLINDSHSVRRRRRCMACDRRFNTYETAEIRMPQVIKSSGERVPFDENKLRTSMMRALHKRPINQDHVEEAILAIKQTIQQPGGRDIPSQKVGELVMGQLSQMDEVAFVRFASVYHSFNDVSEFTQTIARLTQPKSNLAD